MANIKKRDNSIYALTALGAVTVFLGHGLWAIGGKASFVELLSGSFENVLGVTIDPDSAVNWVKIIGWVDITIAVVLALAAIGYLYKKASPALQNLAVSKLVLALYAWGVIWGFLTALSRVTAAGDFYPEIWDLVERGPNFIIPAIGFILTSRARNGKQN